MTDLEYLKKYYKGNLDDAIKRLESGEAVQYIVGNVDFLDYNFDITHNTLCPRFETEQLVSELLELIKKNNFNPHSILDIGTGSGCIAISLANILDVKVDAIDISIEALDVAKKNNHKYGDKVNMFQSDVYSNVKDKYDIIISNPPYIRYDEEIMDIVKTNEPSIALYADDSGLYFYKEIISKAKNYINDKHIIAFEIGQEQGNDIKEIALKYFPNDDILLMKDYAGLDRFIFIMSK